MKFPTQTSRNGFIEGHMPLARSVVWYINQYHNCGYYTPADLEQEAYFALTKAADRYVPELGTEFSTYAWTVIRNHLLGLIRHVQTGWKFETPFIDEEYLNNIPDIEEPICNNYSDDISSKTLQEALDKIKPEWKHIVVEHDLHGKTFKEIVDDVGTTKQNIQQQHTKAMKKLHKLLDKYITK